MKLDWPWKRDGGGGRGGGGRGDGGLLQQAPPPLLPSIYGVVSLEHEGPAATQSAGLEGLLSGGWCGDGGPGSFRRLSAESAPFPASLSQRPVALECTETGPICERECGACRRMLVLCVPAIQS